MQASSSSTFPITNYLAPVSAGNSSVGGSGAAASANGTLLKTAGAPGGVMQLPSGFTFMSGEGPAWDAPVWLFCQMDVCFVMVDLINNCAV